MPPEVLAAYYHETIERLLLFVDSLRPYLMYAVWFLVAIIILTLVLNVVKLIRNLQIPTSLLLLTPPRQTDLSAISTTQLFRLLHNFAQYRPWYLRLFFPAPTFSFEIVSRKGTGIQYLVRVPQDQAQSVKHTLRGYLPGLEIKETADYVFPDAKLSAKVNEYGLRQHFAKPIEQRADFSAHDPIAYLTNGMTQLNAGELMAVQIVARPISRLHDASWSREVTKLQGKIYTNQFNHPDKYLDSTAIGSGLNSFLQLIGGAAEWFGDALTNVIDHAMGNNTVAAVAVTPSVTEQPPSESELQLKALVKGKLEQPLFLTSIRSLVQVEPQQRRSRIQGLTSSFASYTSTTLQGIHPGWTPLQPLHRWQFRKRLLTHPLVLSPSELAGIYHFPQSETTHTEDLVRSRTRELPAPLQFKQADTQYDNVFATNTFGGRETTIGLTLEERRRHTYIIGATGSGKTTLLATMIHQDIVNGKGVAVVDPHGQLVEQLLRTIPEDRIKDVVWFAPDDDGFPIALNLLDLPNLGDSDLTPSQLQKQKSLVVSSVVSIFEKFYDAKYFGPRMEYLLKNSVLAALETPHPTLVTILDLLTKQDIRREIVSRLPAGVVKDYWENEFNQLGSLQRNQMISPITNKVGGILSSPLNYNILSQPHSKLDFEQVMNDGKILLCDLSKGKIGEDESSFFGSLIIAKLQLAALRRARIPEGERRDFYLYVDEFQNFATSAFKALVSEARKYRLATILAHQSISQIEDRDVIRTVLANVGTVICFRTANPEDESFILPIFSPQVTKHEIANLPLYTCYMKVAVGQPQDAFKAEVTNFTAEPSDATAQSVMHSSRATYAVPAGELGPPGAARVSGHPAAETAASIRFDTIESFYL